MKRQVWLIRMAFPLFVASIANISAQQTAPAAAVATPEPAAAKSRIQFQSPIHDFGKISSGETIKHTFYFTNTGSAKLVLTNVHTSCGCTTAGQWTKELEPGQTGTIPIQFSTGNFEGQQAKSITVSCNDPEHPMVYLQVKALIWKPLSISPPYAIMNLTPGSTGGSAKITITNNMDTPVEVWEAKISNPAFSVSLSTNTPGKSYELTVSTVGALKAGSIQGIVSARTTWTNLPTLNFTAWANVQPAISVVPPTITLQAAPLPNKVTPIVTVINNTTNPLTLAEASVNAPDVGVKVHEVQPGRYFTVMLEFPPGFEAPDGKPLELSMKSNNPNHPLLKVPVNQLPRPVRLPTSTSIPAPPPSIAAPPPSRPVSTSSTANLGQLPTTGVRHVLPRPATPLPQPPPLPASTAQKQ